MVYAICLLARRLALPAALILLGAFTYSEAPQKSTEMIEDGSCRTFKGAMMGNDPSLIGTLQLCREGRALNGQLETEGESGFAKVAIVGKMQCDGSLRLSDKGPLEVRPMDDWMFCFDDEFTLNWNAEKETLSGSFVSTDCDDRGTVLMKRY